MGDCEAGWDEEPVGPWTLTSRFLRAQVLMCKAKVFSVAVGSAAAMARGRQSRAGSVCMMARTSSRRTARLGGTGGPSGS